MILTEVSLTKYINDLRKNAAKAGFLEVAILISRESDYKEGYQKLFDAWGDFDSLTGKNIIFMLPFENMADNLAGLNYSCGAMDIYSKLGVKSDQGSNMYCLSKKTVREYKEKICDSQTDAVNDLKSLFGLKENEIPCLAVFPTDASTAIKEACCKFYLKKQSLYDQLKEIVINIEDCFDEYEDIKDAFHKDLIIHTHEKKFLAAVNSLDLMLQDSKYHGITKDELIEHIWSQDKPGIYLKEHFNHQEIACINQYRDLKTSYTDIDISQIKHKKELLTRISEFKEKLNIVLRTMSDTKSDVKSVSTFSITDSLTFSEKVLEEYKKLIENSRSERTLKNEKDFQWAFSASAMPYCREYNWCIGQEVDSGRGPVDFVISRGNDKTVIEFKLTSNYQCVHGLEVQIEEYAKAEGTDKKILVIIDNGRDSFRVNDVLSAEEKLQQEGKNPAKVIIIDAKPKASASKY